jgi:20S proteasome alpha/beta subunit
VREFLEKNHRDDLTRDETVKLAIKSLLEIVQTGAKNIEISVMDGYGQIKVRLPSSPLFTSLTDSQQWRTTTDRPVS